MKEIRNIDLTKVNNGAHRMFMESVAKILAEYEQAIAAHPKTKMLTAEFGKLLQQEKACMGLSRTSLRTAQIAEADHERDMLFTGFKAVVRAFTKGANPETKAAAKTIWLDIAGYRINNRMQLEQQTGVLYILCPLYTSDAADDKARAAFVCLPINQKKKKLRTRHVTPVAQTNHQQLSTVHAHQ